MIETELANKLFVGAEWVGVASGGKTFDVLNPATGEAIATLPDGGRGEMQRAIDAPSRRSGGGPPPSIAPASCARP